MHQHGLTCKQCNCGSVETNPTSENNKLLASAAFLVAEMLGVKTTEKWKKRKRTVLKKTDRKKFQNQRKKLSNFEEIHKGNHALWEKDKKEMV